MKRISLLLLLAMSLLLGCTEDEKPEQDSVSIDSVDSAACKIDTGRIKLILDEIITSDIDCLKTNMKQFDDFVRRDNPDYIEIDDLRKFIERFFKTDAPDIVKSLNFLFDLNSLALRDPRGFLSVDKIDDLFEIIQIVNRHGVPLNKLFKDIDDPQLNLTYWDVRFEIEYLVGLIVRDVTEVIKDKAGPSITLDTLEFLEDFKESMDFAELDLEVIKKFLFVKKVIAGGEVDTFTTDEIFGILPRMKTIAMLGLDFIYAKDLELKTDKEKDLFYFEKLTEAKTVIQTWDSVSVRLFDLNNVIQLAEELLKDSDIDAKNLEDSLINVKRNLIQGDGYYYTYGDVLKIIELAEHALSKFVYFDHVFMKFEDELLKNEPVPAGWERPRLGLDNLINPSVQLDHWQEFYTIARTYRLFHSDDGFHFFTNKYQRTLWGFKLQGLLRWGLNLVFKHYGYVETNPDTGAPIGMYGDETSVERFINDVAGALQEIGLFPDYGVKRFASEAMTSSDLFQNQSNGDGKIQLPELTEYVANILSSANFAGDVIEVMKTHCDVVDDDDSFDVPCYREWFFHVLFEELNYKKYWAKLYDYSIFYSADEVKEFLYNVEKFGRVTPDEDLPMTKIDMGRLFTSLSNIESVFIRFDHDEDNILDNPELEEGWPLFRNTILEVGGLKQSQANIGRSIFFFIVKKMRIPSTVEGLAYHLFGRKKKVTARRMNLGAIFALVAEATIPTEP